MQSVKNYWKKQNLTNKLETLFVKQVYRVAVVHLFLASLWFYTFTNSGSERQLLMEKNGICIQYKLANISKSVFTTFVATNSFYWCAIVQTVLFVRQSLSMISTFIHLNNPCLCLVHIFMCRLHSLCLQFKSFCPVLWIYNQNNSSVSGRSGCFVG